MSLFPVTVNLRVHNLVGRALISQALILSIAAVAMLTGFSQLVSADDYNLTEVAPGLFLHQGRHEQILESNLGDIGNSGFIVGSASVAVIDPGGSIQMALQLKKALREHTQLPVKYLILTHFHPDHIAGASVFSEAQHTVAHANYPRALTQRAQFYLERFPWLLSQGIDNSFHQPDLLVDEAVMFDLGDRELKLRAHKTAHTDNDLTIHDVQSNTLWASDLVFSTRTPSLDGNLNGWIALLYQLDSEKYDSVVPGHGAFSNWSTAVAPLILYLEALRDTVRQQIATGVRLADAVNQAAANVDPAWKLREEQHPVNVTKAYTELEWE